ncbi:MAG TPA: 5-formyltetrahydrofolate cyclo-ligase [Candidatus Lumbricidophila sp.]|nr:5-formyltetrahydrofolate cyclo-ligase [Candidatus Lumbricidophila sp.]
MHPDPVALRAAKRALRATLRADRQALTATERAAAGDGLTAQLEALVAARGATSVSCYLPTDSEPNTRGFIDWAAARGIRLLFPVTRDDGLLDWTVGESGDECVSHLGVPEPSGELLGPAAINDVDLVLIPAAAVDRSGIRMGWGRGYFDRTLGSMAKCPPVYAVIFDAEFLDQVPCEVHDQPVNGVVTPTRTITFEPHHPRSHPETHA